MSRFSLSHLASDHLAQIREYVAQDKPEAARRLLSGLFTRFRRLAQQPELGEKHDDLRPNLHRVRIVRIVHGARDVTAVFDLDA